MGAHALPGTRHIKSIADRNRDSAIDEADVVDAADDIWLAIQFALSALRGDPRPDDYGYVLAQIERRWPRMPDTDVTYSVGYALGQLAERDRLLEHAPTAWGAAQ